MRRHRPFHTFGSSRDTTRLALASLLSAVTISGCTGGNEATPVEAPAAAENALPLTQTAVAGQGSPAPGSPQTDAERIAGIGKLSPETLGQWQAAIRQAPLPKPSAKDGSKCFKAFAPDPTWTEVECAQAPDIPFLPYEALAPQTVGGSSSDYAARLSGDILEVDGSFPSVTNVTSVTSNGVANSYSLQANTNHFVTSMCAGASNPANCEGWQQFVYSNSGASGAALIQYWLIAYYNPCPSGWHTAGVSCWINGGSVQVPNQAISNLNALKLVGSASAGTDLVRLEISGGAAYVATTPTVLGLGPGWTTTEFNILGNGNSYQAIFNSDATIRVRLGITLANGGLGAPACAIAGFAGETNNLSFIPSTCCPTRPLDPNAQPYIEFTETNASTVSSPFCLLNGLQALL